MEEKDELHWEALTLRLQNMVKTQEAELNALGGEIDDIKRVSRILYPFPDLSTSSETTEEEDKLRDRAELEEQIKAEKERSAKLAAQLDESLLAIQRLQLTQKNAISPSEYSQVTGELAQLKQVNARLVQDMEAAKADMKVRRANDKKVKRDVSALEKNFEQLSNLYNQVVEQKNTLKGENSELLRNIMEKDETIAQMQKRLREVEEDTLAATQSLALESAVYIAGRASFPGSKMKKSARHYVRVFDSSSHRLSLRGPSDIPAFFRSRPKRKSSLDGSQ